MPTYAYACTACDHRFEAQQSFSDDALTECPECAGRLRKLFNSVGIVFKGSGFYRTDSRDSGKAGAAKNGTSKDTAKESTAKESSTKESTSSGSSGTSAGSGSSGSSSSSTSSSASTSSSSAASGSAA